MSDYIPHELVSIILARSSTKTVLRCTSVCKSWYHLITSSSFIYSHLNLSSSNCGNRILFRWNHKDKDRYYIYRDDVYFNPITVLESPHTSNHWNFWIIGTFNGLICCYDEHKGVILWNLSLKKSVVLGERKVYSKYVFNGFCLGFGYLPSTDSYKIVKILYYSHQTEGSKRPKVEIYDLETTGCGGYWRCVEAGDFPYIVHNSFQQAYLNGILHWTGNKCGGNFENLIVSFDMKSEKLGTLILPECMQTCICILYVRTYRETLCVLNRHGDNALSVWAMKEYGIEDSWEKLIKLDIGPHFRLMPICLRKNGEILLEKTKTTTSRFCESSLVSYDPKTNKGTDVVSCKKGTILFADMYVDSLVLINFRKGARRQN